MKTDRSGRTFEEYRQLYWDGQKRIAELEAALKAKTAEFDRLLRRDTDNLKRLIAAQATLQAIRELKPRIVYLDPDRLEIIEVIMFDDLVAALEQTNE